VSVQPGSCYLSTSVVFSILYRYHYLIISCLTSFCLVCRVVRVIYYIYWHLYYNRHHVLSVNNPAFHGINYAAYHIHDFAFFVACSLCMYSMPLAAHVLLTSLAHLMWVIPIVRCLRKIAKSTHWLYHVCLSVCLYACNNSALTGWFFMKFDTWVFLKSLLRIFKFH
jgi:hypothetical protein